MKNFFASLIFFLSLCSLSHAALPPLAQTSLEMRAILEDPRLFNSLKSGEAINEIIRRHQGYTVVTTHHILEVDLHYKPAELMGPVPFELEFHPVYPLAP